MTLFDLINSLRARSNKPVWDVANAVHVELIRVEPSSVQVRLSGNADLGRILQAGPPPAPKNGKK